MERGGWTRQVLIVEDDIQLSPGIDVAGVLPAFAEAAASTTRLRLPAFYAGICAPEWTTNATAGGGGLEGPWYRRASGYCTHAYAVNSRRALWLLDAIKKLSTLGETRYYMIQAARLYIDARMHVLGQQLGGLVVTHPSHRSPDVETHFGTFYQARSVYPTTIGRGLPSGAPGLANSSSSPEQDPLGGKTYRPGEAPPVKKDFISKDRHFNVEAYLAAKRKWFELPGVKRAGEEFSEAAYVRAVKRAMLDPELDE